MDLIFYIGVLVSTVIIGRLIYVFFRLNYDACSSNNLKKIKTMIILGSGGHTTEMIKIISNLDLIKYAPRIYIHASSDEMSYVKLQQFEKNSKDFSVIAISRSREVGQSYITSVITTLVAFFSALKILLNENPDVILSNGPGTAVPLCLGSLILRLIFISKAKVIFIESFCRVNTFSLTGKILYYFSDYVIVQWPKLYRHNGAHEKMSIAPLTTDGLMWSSFLDNCNNCLQAEIKNHVMPLIRTLRSYLRRNEMPSDNWILNAIIKLEVALDRIWEELNTGHWTNVSMIHRYSYAISSILKSIVLEIYSQCENVNKNMKMQEILEQIDKGLLLGAVHKDDPNSLTSIATRINKYFADKMSDDIETSFECTIDDLPKESISNCVSLKRHETPGMETFYTEMFRPKYPGVLEGCIEHWRAVTFWKDPKYLIKKAGWRTVPIEIGSHYTHDDWSQSLMTLKDFIESFILQTPDKIGYLAQHQLFEQIPELNADFDVPDYCTFSDENAYVSVEKNIWFGPKGTVSPLHYDPKNNLLCQVFGYKRILLYPPDDGKYLYGYGTRLLNNTARVDPLNPDYIQFPQFQMAKGQICYLKPGDMLYIPPKWWHYVSSLTPSLSISFWFT